MLIFSTHTDHRITRDSQLDGSKAFVPEAPIDSLAQTLPLVTPTPDTTPTQVAEPARAIRTALAQER